MVLFEATANISSNPHIVFLIKVVILLLFLSFLSSVINDTLSRAGDDMLVLLFKFIFFTVNSLSNLVFHIIFTSIAHFIVLAIHGLKESGEATMWILRRVMGFVRSILESVVGLIFEAASSILSIVFDLVKDLIVEAFGAASSTVGRLAEMVMGSVEGLLRDVLGVAGGFKEMISTLASDLWNNCLEAMGYIKDNA